ncbi:hypothetical protein PoB_006903500 [Plakobranchus ocellatus]|uniref:Uncharacterized protein n=1 Tax=Plakobranchus ocellatus TaxID=259542 RepID=A0AAV4DEX5_9GAST|nr:hypothetical protein PoB_006903500 [Plakobranchus ocellatus]
MAVDLQGDPAWPLIQTHQALSLNANWRGAWWTRPRQGQIKKSVSETVLRLYSPPTSHISSPNSSFFVLYIVIPQQRDLKLSGLPPGQAADDEARARDRKVPASLRADSSASVPPTPQSE